MKTGIIYGLRRPTVYYKLKRQVVMEFAPALKQATGWERTWLRWKRAFILDIRYNRLLFSHKEQSVQFTINPLIPHSWVLRQVKT